VCPAVCIQNGEIKAGCFVDQAAILRSYRPMLRENIVGTHAVEEGSPGLLGGTRKTAAGVTGWIKYQSTAASRCIWLNPSKAWQFPLLVVRAAIFLARLWRRRSLPHAAMLALVCSFLNLQS